MKKILFYPLLKLLAIRKWTCNILLIYMLSGCEHTHTHTHAMKQVQLAFSNRRKKINDYGSCVIKLTGRVSFMTSRRNECERINITKGQCEKLASRVIIAQHGFYQSEKPTSRSWILLDPGTRRKRSSNSCTPTPCGLSCLWARSNRIFLWLFSIDSPRTHMSTHKLPLSLLSLLPFTLQLYMQCTIVHSTRTCHNTCRQSSLCVDIRRW